MSLRNVKKKLAGCFEKQLGWNPFSEAIAVELIWQISSAKSLTNVAFVLKKL